MYEKYFNSIAHDLELTFKAMTCLSIHQTVIKKNTKSERINSPLIYSIEFRHEHENVKGFINMSFEDAECAESVAMAIASVVGLKDEEIAKHEYLSEYLNTATGLALTTWEKHDLSLNFAPPKVLENASLSPHLCDIESCHILMRLDVSHILFEITFIDSSYEAICDKKLLVVDDSLMIRQMLYRKFSQLGFDIEVARDGVEAVKKTREFKPDLTIMDQIMPNLSGLDAILEIEKFSPDAKFVMFTSSAHRDEVITAKTLNVLAYLIKPLDFSVIFKVISKILLEKYT